MTGKQFLLCIAGVVVLANLLDSSAPTQPKHPPSTMTPIPPAVTTDSLVFPRPAAQTFNGYPCTIDCSGHEAGYEWAQDNMIDDADQCDGNSESFNEGCRAFVEEQE